MRAQHAAIVALLLVQGCGGEKTPPREGAPKADPPAPSVRAPEPPAPASVETAARKTGATPLEHSDTVIVPPPVNPPVESPPETASRAAAAPVREARRRSEAAVAVQPAAVDPAVKAALPAAIAKSRYSAILLAVYAARGNEPLFLSGRSPSRSARVLADAIADLPRQFMDPAPYRMPTSDMLERPAQSAAAAAQLDARLAAALVQYVVDFRFAYRAHPTLLTRDWDAFEQEQGAAIAEVTAPLLDSLKSGLAGLVPKDPRYERILREIPRYQALAGKDAKMPTLDVDWRTRTIQEGERSPRVKKVQKRLALQGYYSGPTTGVLDGDTMKAVATFQQEHALDDDGKVGKSTLRALNVKFSVRLQQLKLGLVRLREYRPRREAATTYLHVNLPGFHLQLYRDGALVRDHRVIVGNNDLDFNRREWRQGYLNRTPLMKTNLYKIVLNPVWILPKRIRDEVSSATAQRKGYREVNSSKGNFMIQGPGKSNALGRVKFLLEKTNAVYLHDTDKRHLFGRSERARSHGCMRVDQAVELAEFLADWKLQMPKEEVQRILETGKTRVLELPRALTVYTGYNTVGLTDDDRIVFHEDIYGYDKAFFRGDLPPRRWTRFGSPAMRPRGVPRIPFKDFRRIKAEGGVAPMTWPPKQDAGG